MPGVRPPGRTELVDPEALRETPAPEGRMIVRESAVERIGRGRAATEIGNKNVTHGLPRAQ